MSCSGCNSVKSNSGSGGCSSNGYCQTGGCAKLGVFNWLAGFENKSNSMALAEVRFKNTRKEFYKIADGLEINAGNEVVVEAQAGYDIGIVSLTGDIVEMQMHRKGINQIPREIKKVLRIATQPDIDKWKQAQELEHQTMLEARKAVTSLKLDMKIGDVEYQGDKTKATFYYIADGRVDFRELLKVLAEKFRVRIEMRQIGARQEAGRIGGIGSCGRELCCSTWMNDFRSVSTNAARYQQLALNPLKLAGQCGKLKCCLNYELDAYMDALKEFPRTTPRLETQKGTANHQKTDIFRRKLFYAYQDEPDKFISLDVERVKEIISLNKKGVKPLDLKDDTDEIQVKTPDYENVVGQDSVTRFDKNKKKNKPKHHNPRENRENKGQTNHPKVSQSNSKDVNRDTKPQSPLPKPQNTAQNTEKKDQGNNQRHQHKKFHNPQKNNNPSNDKK